MAHTNLVLGGNWDTEDWPDYIDVSHERDRLSVIEAIEKRHTWHPADGRRRYVPERECHLVKVGPLIVKGTGYLLSCGHMAHGSEPVYCPVCGAKVVQE